MRRLLSLSFFVLIAYAFSNAECGPSGFDKRPCGLAFSSNTIVIATVTRLDPQGGIAFLNTMRAFKGERLAEIRFSHCLEVGTTYLIYAIEPINHRTALLNKAVEIDKAAAELAFLESMDSDSALSSLFGKMNFTEEQEKLLAKQFRGVHVFAKSGRKTYSTVIKDDLTFDFGTVLPGDYEIEVERVPEEIEVEESRWNLLPGECKQALVDVSYDTGLVIQFDQPISFSGFRVGIFPVLDDGSISEEGANAGGSWGGKSKEYSAGGMPPGKYLVAVNPGGIVDGNIPFPTTYYPGVPDQQSAAIVTIKGGELTRIGMKLPPPVKNHKLTVRTMLADGTAVAHVYLGVHSTSGAYAFGDITNDEGSATFNVLDDPGSVVEAYDYGCYGPRIQPSRVKYAGSDKWVKAPPIEEEPKKVIGSQALGDAPSMTLILQYVPCKAGQPSTYNAPQQDPTH